MNYEEAREKALKVKWRTEVCNSGEDCWCRIITTETPIIHNNNEEYYIIGEGSVSEIEAHHIVELHNKSLIEK